MVLVDLDERDSLSCLVHQELSSGLTHEIKSKIPIFDICNLFITHHSRPIDRDQTIYRERIGPSDIIYLYALLDAE